MAGDEVLTSWSGLLWTSMLLQFQWVHYLVTRTLVKLAGAASDFKRVHRLWFSLGKAGIW